MGKITKQSPVAKLIQQANGYIEQADNYTRNAVGKYLQAGNALNRAKESCQHGDWGEWLAENWNYTDRWASTLMRLERTIDVDKLPPDEVQQTVKRLVNPSPKGGKANRKYTSDLDSTRQGDDDAIDAEFTVVDVAKKVRTEGSKELNEQVGAGKIPVSVAAKLIDTEPSKAKQTEIVKEGPKAVRDHIEGTPEPEDPKAQQKATKKLLSDYLAKAMRTIDDYHEVNPNKKAHAQMMDGIQELMGMVWGVK